MNPVAAATRGLVLASALLVLAVPVLASPADAGQVQPSQQNNPIRPGGSCPACGDDDLPPIVSLVSPLDGQTFVAGQPVTLTATARDTDGYVESVTFLVDGVDIGTDTTAPYSVQWAGATGDHTVLAQAVDGMGTVGTSSLVNIQIHIETAPPSPPPPIPPSATSRTETLTYHDDPVHWVMGQTASVTCVASVPASTSCDGDDVMSQTNFDPNTALPTATYAFGQLQSSMTYNADGTLHTVTDGRGNTTTLANWKRGVPQSITYADGSTQSATVNEAGWITQMTDANGYTTGYGYDAMGRLAQITYPGSWAPTTRSFVPVASVEYGLPAGHWRLTETTGNAVKSTYYDALWRPVLVRQYDSANVAATERFTRTAYDALGRVSFAAYPSTSSSPTTGVWTEYDALGRPTAVAQDSELGLLVTSTTYNAGFTTTVTNPRGQSTTTAYLTFDQPSTDWPTTVIAPEGQTTTLDRDPYGKPTALTRSGPGGSLTRSYAYNGHQQLCRSEEPETGVTLYGYDAAGNLRWSAAGLPSSQGCSPDGSEPAVQARRVDRTYDARNRLQTLTFPDGNGNQSWTYTPDGLPATVTTANGGSPVTNTWSYNNRRLLTGQTVQPDTAQTWTLSYGYNPLGQVTSETLPDGATLTYTVNALGQVTQVKAQVTGSATKTLASNASYYPNGALAQFSYGNGIVHTMTQNARQLPARSTDCTLAGSCAQANRRLDLSYTFDENGNVAAIQDGTATGRQTRTMAYDGLDRLTSTTSPMFGTASYGYDGQDNLTHTAVTGGSHPHDSYYCYDGQNRLEFVRSGPTCVGNASPAITALEYDAQGNLSQKNTAAYAFDFGNRLRTTAGQSYRYDADGRRVRQDTAGSQLKYSVYAQDGRLVWQRDEPNNRRIHNVYFAGSLLAELSRPLTGNTLTVTYQHTDALGSPIARTNASKQIIETSEYEPFGALLNRANDDRAGYTGHVMDAASGLTYMQQRYYDPSIGRFLSVDPVTAYSNPVGAFNRYWYVSNNPYKFVDPTGKEPGKFLDRTNSPDTCEGVCEVESNRLVLNENKTPKPRANDVGINNSAGSDQSKASTSANTEQSHDTHQQDITFTQETTVAGGAGGFVAGSIVVALLLAPESGGISLGGESLFLMVLDIGEPAATIAGAGGLPGAMVGATGGAAFGTVIEQSDKRSIGQQGGGGR